MDSMIHVGVSGKAVNRVAKAINDILGSNVADAVQLAALDALKSACHVSGTTIQNCTLKTQPEKMEGKKKGK